MFSLFNESAEERPPIFEYQPMETFGYSNMSEHAQEISTNLDTTTSNRNEDFSMWEKRKDWSNTSPQGWINDQWNGSYSNMFMPIVPSAADPETAPMEKVSPMDMQHYDQPPTNKRRDKGIRNRPKPNHTPRPPNSFILYRRVKHAEIVSNFGGNTLNNNVISKMVGEMWKNESPQIKAIYTEQAEEEKKAHKLRHPDYKYQPKKNAIKDKKKMTSRSNSDLYDETLACADVNLSHPFNFADDRSYVNLFQNDAFFDYASNSFDQLNEMMNLPLQEDLKDLEAFQGQLSEYGYPVENNFSLEI